MYFGNLVDTAKFIRRTHNTFHADGIQNCLSILGYFNDKRISRNEDTMQFVSSMYIEESKKLLYTTIILTKLYDGRWKYVETVDDVVENYIPFC